MNCEADVEKVCASVADQLCQLAEALSPGNLNHADFMRAILVIEANEVASCGLTLSASNTLDNWTRFTLRSRQTRSICAAFEFLPETNEFRRIRDLSTYDPHCHIGA